MHAIKILFKKKIKRQLQKGIAFKMALILLFNCGWPSVALALSGGPSQPEVQSFEPVGVSDMVDLFSGDFSYNIPLFDMDGYPMNISYHSGNGMDQEASWVGLGWNINPGVINRNMRGIPDDFDGDMIVKEQNVKKNQTVGISCGFASELFGYDGASLSARLGIKYNNYTGVGVEQSFNVAVSSSSKFGSGISLGITSSSDDGLSLSPSISLSASTGKTENGNKVGVSLGASYNSRGGLTALTIAPDISQSFGIKNGSLRGVANGAIGKVGGARFNLGQQTYSPHLDFPMANTSVTGSFKFGAEAWGVAASIAPTGYYMEQGQLTNVIASPAYGFMNAHDGQFNPKAMMDFNREKDGTFNKSTYNLPITNLTYDLYSVSGQGTGGSYRPFRSDVGHVFDTESYSTTDGYSASAEIGAGAIFKGGVDFVTNSAYSHSGDWTSAKAGTNMSFQASGANTDYETWYFKEANERSVNSDPDFLNRYGGTSAVKFELDGDVDFDVKTTGKLLDENANQIDISPSDQRKSRDKRNQSIISLTNREVYEGLGLFGGSAGSGMKNDYIKNNIAKLGHHIGQITSMNTDGKRYVYALPAYNKSQEEVTFAVGKPVGGGSARAHAAGLVTYNPAQDNAVTNKMGLDNYYSNTKMPAFAYSYMLSAVLSSDYVDVTGDGPTDDDLGNYTLFDYTLKASDYKWRTPTDQNKAKFSEGLLADENDDKGSYVYGVKQVYYLNTITTKNYLAQFNLLQQRKDMLGVNDKNGGISSGDKQYELDNIVLTAKSSGKVIKTVHFVYDYLLCPGTANSSAVSKSGTISNGKLTLTNLYFTYQNSDKGAYNSYDFSYYDDPTITTRPSDDPENPAYRPLQYDRWGNYKSSNPAPGGVPIPMEYYPYVNQALSQDQMDKDAAIYNLKQIKLPSGGKIKIEYESDDYAYVQDQVATQMYTFSSPSSTSTPITDDFEFVFDIPAGCTATKIEDFLPDNHMVFFKFKMLIKPGNTSATDVWDYVPGYAEVDLTSTENGTTPPIKRSRIENGKGHIAFVAQGMDENIPSGPMAPQRSPVVLAALQFGRLNTPRVIWDQPNASAAISSQIASALLNSNFMTNIQAAMNGPNAFLYNQQKAQTADLHASWIKLKDLTGKKYGGGARVKRIILDDDFQNMTGEESSHYGQVYTYTTRDSKGRLISSGVASYEPQMGGEENALKVPFFTETRGLLAPDEQHYTEAPFGESFYPSASVGYSAVRVENYYPKSADLPSPWSAYGFESKKTGYMLHEFYTSKDFPTISERTELEAIEDKSNPLDLASIFNIDTKDYMTASQGFYVELNDMHGKPKSVKTYNRLNKEINSVEYFYKSQPYGNGSKRLTNTVTVVKPNGGVSQAEVGVFFDAVGDLREQTTESQTDGVNINTDIIEVVTPIITIVPIPSFASDKTQFRSAAITKVVQRFGILDKTITRQDGSSITSSDLAYDSETGEVLLTQTMNEYNDAMYSFKYPAYWYYDGMGPAYKNIGYMQTLSFANGKAIMPTGTNLYATGDEVEIQTIPTPPSTTVTYSKGWVKKSLQDSVWLINSAGTYAPSQNAQYKVKVIRSGRRNMQTMEMASLSSMINPLAGIRGNVYQRVVNASATEYDNYWSADCKCLPTGAVAQANPYLTGQLGNWHTKRTVAYLSPRTQTNANNNSNLRVDGFYTSYTPYFKNWGGRWKINPQGWTSTRDVTEVTIGGQEVENMDPLGHYSSASFGFNQSIAVAMSSNSKYTEHGYMSFEEYDAGFSPMPPFCSQDNHFMFSDILGTLPGWSGQLPGSAHPSSIWTLDSHTGQNCIAVPFSIQGSNSFGLIEPISTDCTKPVKCPGTFIYQAGSFVLQNAEPPYSFEVQKMNGSGNILINDDGDGFKVVLGDNTFKCLVTAIDSKGCIYTKLVRAPFN